MKKTFLTVIMFACSVFLTAVVSTGSAFAEEKVTFEEAFGAAAGAVLYDTQMILGITADSLVKGVYTPEKTIAIIDDTKRIVAVLKQYSQQLLKSTSVSTSDKKTLKEISDCIDKLNATADALKSYVKKPNNDNAVEFDNRRKISYGAIAELLGLKK